MTTGQYISKLSEERRFSQSDVARQTGLSRQIISYIISGKRELTLQQALRLESLFNLKQGTLVRMQDDERIHRHIESIRKSLCTKLLDNKTFLSYSDVTEETISDGDLIEKTFIHLDMDDIKLLFELFPMRFVRRVWEDRMAGQGAYLYSLNMMIAQYYFNIRNPKAFLHKKELEQVKKMQEDGIMEYRKMSVKDEILRKYRGLSLCKK